MNLRQTEGIMHQLNRASPTWSPWKERGWSSLWVSIGWVLLLVTPKGCAHHSDQSPPSALEQLMLHEPPDALDVGAGTSCNSAVSRIYALIARGEFAEARALIAEASAAGLLSQQHASRLLHRITQLNTKLGEIPARLQRVKNFPSQLKDFTLFQIEKMLDDGDFSLATKAQLKEAVKLIKEQTRLMEKI